MARIPESEIERLKLQVSVVRLVEAAGIALKPHGKDQVGRCPFPYAPTIDETVTL